MLPAQRISPTSFAHNFAPVIVYQVAKVSRYFVNLRDSAYLPTK